MNGETFPSDLSHAAGAVGAREPRCGICGGSRGHAWTAREMMFGMRETFTYRECGDCGCLQFASPATDLRRFYPASYYSLETPRSARGILGWLRGKRNVFAFTGRGLLGSLLQRRSPYPIDGVSDWLQRIGGGLSSRILDVGCGTGALVHDLAAAGFEAPIGVDPYIDHDLRYPNGAVVLRGEVTAVEGEFDLIIFNHSLEHIADQLGTLTAVRRLLSPAGLCVARTPTVTSYAWEHYRTDWVQLDAPRHLYIHSVTSMHRLAADAGLRVEGVVYDSCEFQFVGSELYRRDVPYVEANGHFSASEIRRFRERARNLNAAGRGDQACFFLRRT